MTRRGAAGGGLARVLMLFALLAGVLAMHALTADHHAEMSASAQPGAHVSTAGAGHQKTLDADRTGRPIAMTAEMPSATSSVGLRQQAEIGTGSAEKAMSSLCLAILSLILLLGVRLTRAWWCAARSGVAPLWSRSGRLARWLGRSPPWLTPSLSKLCVLRT